jgi:cytidine deaminase
MKQYSLRVDYVEYDSSEMLLPADRKLLDQATLACKSAYAPYSGFSVGAAILMADGKVILGNNQENSVYPSGLCAERVALFAASANHPGIPIVAIAITATTDRFKMDGPVTPCGSCRQVLAEYEQLHGQPIRIIMSGSTDEVRIVESTRSLLPFLFHAELLKK